MAYVLNDKIKIDKPIVFLCGPYYNDADKSDRRKILQDFFLKKFPNHCLPLIIDDFLTKENIGDDSVSIQLLEEIFAGISHKTYIFLDTMSSAVELGLFTNSAYNNSLYILIPHEKERNCGTIGVFTKDVVLEDNVDRVKSIYYHPRIERVAFSTDYVGEFYKFINDQLPVALEQAILQDYAKNIQPEYKIVLMCNDSYPKNDYCINYQYNKKDNNLVVFISVKLLFYIVGGIVYSEYAENLRRKEKLDFNYYNIDNAVSHLKSLVLAFMLKNTFLGVNGKTKISIQTVLAKDIEDVVKHIVTFIFIYHKNARLKGYFFVGKNEVIKELDLKVNPTDFFDLTSTDIDFIKLYNSKSFECFITFELKTGYKKREIITYASDDNGQAMRELHEKIALILNQEHLFNEHSFAYQKGKSVKECAECHKCSISFLKFDIHKFFNSIDKKKLVKKLIKEFELDAIYEEQVSIILDTCFREGKMPIGLITSPVLSDIYMKDFDGEFAKEIGNHYIYTRYADDILISHSDIISQEEELRIKSLLKKMLGALGLNLNENKYMRRDLTKRGDYIKYLGLNIVKNQQKNVITVGKAYKNYIAKCYLKYIGMNNDKETKEKYYFGKQIAGYLSFVKMIEGEDGLKKIYNRIEKSTEGRVLIKDRINNL
jgi:hypothetical protein